ncbi:MAG: hypothetical protein ACFE75_13555 [Candidatus Hodarchaeota archaeon]
MKVNGKYHELLEEILRNELEWLKEEFKILFESKMEKYTENDRKIANGILDYILENTYVSDNIFSLSLLNDVIDNIEKKYINLF